MNIIQVAKLHTEFLRGQRYTRHVQETSQPGRRAVKQVDCWERDPCILGKGGGGIVYLDKCIYSDGGSKGQTRAVKIVKRSEKVKHERELEAIVLFSHEKYRRCFVESFGWFDTAEEIFITMEYLRLGDLQHHLESQQAGIPESETKVIVTQILEGLQYMHDLGFTHRDIKPGNIMIVELGPAWWVKIADFGISKRCLEDMTALRTRSGTPEYMAPEFLERALSAKRGEHAQFSYTNAVDIWALGMTVYVLLLGELPFNPLFQDLQNYSCGKLEFPANAMFEKGMSIKACEFTRSLMVPRPEDRPDVAECLTHHWLEKFSTPTEDTSDPLTQALIERDTQASLSWDSNPLAMDTDLNLEETVIHLAGSPSQPPQASAPSQDSGICMSFDTLQSTANKAPANPSSIRMETSTTNPSRPRGWCMEKELKYDSGEIRALASSPDRKVLVSGGDDKILRIWNTETWTQTDMILHKKRINDLAFTPCGRFVATASGDEIVRLWDVKTSKLTATFSGPEGEWFHFVAISPDGSLLAAGDHHGVIHLFAMPSEVKFPKTATGVSGDKERPPGRPLRMTTRVWLRDKLQVLVFSPDGRLLASGDMGNNVKIWDPKTMLLVATFAHTAWGNFGNGVKAVAFSGDSKLLASTNQDSVRIWDVATGIESERCTSFYHGSYGAHFTFDGRLAFGDEQNLVIWDFQTTKDPTVAYRVRGWMGFNFAGAGVTKVISWPDGTIITAATSIKVWRPSLRGSGNRQEV